jgi:hypothetical protein
VPEEHPFRPALPFSFAKKFRVTSFRKVRPKSRKDKSTLQIEYERPDKILKECSMCDYSLYVTENRLAKDGEQLVLHRFSTGSLGFASVRDLEQERAKTGKTGFWTALKESLLCQTTEGVPAICIPPGARLLLTDIPQKVQESFQIGPSETVVFTEISSRSYSYRDALQFSNGTQVLLQDLAEGIHAEVLSMALENEMEPEMPEMVAVHRR